MRESTDRIGFPHHPRHHSHTPEKFVTSGQLSKLTGISQSRIQHLAKTEGLPAYRLDERRYVFDSDEAEAWLREHGHLVDPYRAAIERLIDAAAPPLTAEQAQRIRSVLSGSTK